MSAGIPGLAQDFVFNYLGRDAFHSKNGPIVIGFREFASLLGNAATSDDPLKRKKEFKNVKATIEATVRDLVGEIAKFNIYILTILLTNFSTDHVFVFLATSFVKF